MNLYNRTRFILILLFIVQIMACDWFNGDSNNPPVAVLTATPQSIVAPGIVSFDASGSYDTDGSIVRKTIDYGDGVVEDIPNSQIDHEYAKVGTYQASLTVYDNENATHTFTVQVVFDEGLKWSTAVDKPIYYSTPAIATNGTIYVGTGIYLHTSHGTLYAINPDGSIQWSQALDEVSLPPGNYMDNAYSPAIGPNGNIYIQGSSGALYAYDVNGTRLWRFASFDYYPVFHEVGQRTPAITTGGTIYLAADALYALDSSGNMLWRFPTSGTNYGWSKASPVIAPDGTIYVMMGQDYLYAVNPNGTEKWQFRLDHDYEMSFASPAVDSQGNVYLGAEAIYDGFVYAVSSSGTKLWRYAIPGIGRVVRASPTIGPDDTLYIGTKAGYDSNTQTVYNGKLIAFDKSNGNIKWEYEVVTIHQTPDDIYSTPTIGVDGTIYFGAETGQLYAINSLDGTLKWSIPLQGGINWSSAALLTDGTIYIGSHNTTLQDEWLGTLHAIQTESYGLATPVWPKFRHDNLNTGDYNH